MQARASIRKAAGVVRAGGIIAYPTEGVFGFGCDPSDPAAVARICRLKQRPLSAGLILIAAHPAQLAGFTAPNDDELACLLAEHAAPITWIVSAGPLCPGWITGGRDTVAVRLTRHPLAAALCEAADLPLVSTSANRRGRPPARSALQVRRWFGARVDLVVPGSTGGLAGPTEIRDARSGRALRPAT